MAPLSEVRTPVRSVTDVVLSSETESFREVKLVEFSYEGSDTLGFVTTETPDALAEPTPHDEMVTMFLPMAPDPVTGGHLVHLPTDPVMDVDLTIEQGVQTIVTSGVADSGLDGGLSGEEMKSLAEGGTVYRRTPPERVTSFHRPPGSDRAARYRAGVDPAHTDRPRDLAERVDRDADEEGTKE